MHKRSLLLFLFFISIVAIAHAPVQGRVEINVVSTTIDLKSQDIQMYWKDDHGEVIRSLQRLKDFLGQKHARLIFAMNGGMFKTDNTPQGLFIQHQTEITPLDTASGFGNFYLKPNGVFYIKTDKTAGICTTQDFTNDGNIAFATQSGPMLLIDGAHHPAFKKGSSNLNVRNGVGILPDGRLLFAMSKTPVNFYDFASYFKEQGCKNALYLDGFVSRTYLPEAHWTQTDGNFGVIIGASISQ